MQLFSSRNPDRNLANFYACRFIKILYAVNSGSAAFNEAFCLAFGSNQPQSGKCIDQGNAICPHRKAGQIISSGTFFKGLARRFGRRCRRVSAPAQFRRRIGECDLCSVDFRALQRFESRNFIEWQVCEKFQESPDIGIIGVGEGSTPQLKGFFDSLGIAEADWMPRCNATYKAGISFHRWSARPGFEHYFHPFPNEIDERTAPAFFYNSVIRRRGANVDGHPDRFFLASVLAQRKLAPLPAYSFPFKSAYGYHFDSALIGRFLREHSTARGVEYLEGTVARVEQAEDGVGVADVDREEHVRGAA